MGQSRIWRIVVTILLITGATLLTIRAYSVRQLQILSDQEMFATPEEGARELIARYYMGITRVEIVRVEKEIFESLRFVEAHVQAASRSDGGELPSTGYDNPGWFFLRIRDRWVFVPEGKLPWIIALGKEIFNL